LKNYQIKNEFNCENSSVFHSSNENISNSNENQSNSHQNNHNLPCYLNDSHRNSHENHNNSNKNSNSHQNSNKNSNSHQNSNGNSQFKTNATSIYDNSKGDACLEPNDSRKIHSKYRKTQLRDSHCDLLQSHDIDDSNNSSNQHKSSDDSYNLTYNKNEKNTEKQNHDTQKFDVFTQNYSMNIAENMNNYENNRNNMINNGRNLGEISQNPMKYPQNMPNFPICIPVQMNQSYNQMPSYNYIDQNKYQYGNIANNQMNSSRNNMNYCINQQNYEIVPNYMISQNPNNSFQFLQVGMSLRPVMMISPESVTRNSMQFTGYVMRNGINN